MVAYAAQSQRSTASILPLDCEKTPFFLVDSQCSSYLTVHLMFNLWPLDTGGFVRQGTRCGGWHQNPDTEQQEK